MKTSSALSCLFALLGIAGSAAAQPVSFRGKVEDVSGTSNQFVVDGTSTALTSSTINLNAFVGEQVLIGGVWNGSSAAPSVSVQTISIVPRTFEVGGNGSIGNEIRFGAFGAPGDAAVLVAALQPTFLPLPGLGVAFLDPMNIIVVGAGAIGQDGNFEVEVAIPNDPAFVGLDVLGQGAISGPGAGLIVANPDSKTIQA
ncbi:MAG: hypothetical protein L0323_15055 [Planctomycetes bacterium]|nr:hypothetical protein [Planctomycetota bacterium]